MYAVCMYVNCICKMYIGVSIDILCVCICAILWLCFPRKFSIFNDPYKIKQAPYFFPQEKKSIKSIHQILVHKLLDEKRN